MKSDPYEFDSQLKFKDVPRARHGLPWEAWELKALYSRYMQSYHLRHICDLMQRPKEDVLSKLVSLGLITKEIDGFFWIWKRKVLPEAWKVGLPSEKANPAKPQSDDSKRYPDLVNSVFEDASCGVATSPDLSGLGIRTTTFDNTPKETIIMKFETRTFVNDVDASTLTDDEIFGEIRRAEKRIEELKAIKTTTKKLADSITKLEEYASKLAAYVDAR